MQRYFSIYLISLFSTILFHSCAWAESGLRLPPTLSDGMIIQRHHPINIKGFANAGEQVRVEFLQQSQTTTCDESGKWLVTFPAQHQGGPYTMTITSGGESITLSDIYLGEVWLCSGQSNMQLPVREIATAKEDIAQASQQTKVRLLNMRPSRIPFSVVWEKGYIDSLQQNKYYNCEGWTSCNAKTVSNFSAIGYHFARIIAQELDCHVGVICNAVDGSLCESWIDRPTLDKNLPMLCKDWLQQPLIQSWARNRVKKNMQQDLSSANHHPYAPSYLFNCGIAPLSGTALAGVLWYQGEGNAHNATMHEQLFPLLQNSWRTHFQQPELPFYFVQLSGISTLPTWGHFRDSQRRLSTLPHTYMTVCHDLGEPKNIHPTRKRQVAERLAAAALHHEYNKSNIPCGPIYLGATLKESKLTLHFQYADGLKTSDGKAPQGFEIAGEKGNFISAKARIVGNTIQVWHESIPKPAHVRYAWPSYPITNVVNRAGFPISTFTDRIF